MANPDETPIEEACPGGPANPNDPQEGTDGEGQGPNDPPTGNP